MVLSLSRSVRALWIEMCNGGRMGIGYIDSVIVYNRYVRKTDEAEQYFGTRFDKVRVELTECANIAKSGL